MKELRKASGTPQRAKKLEQVLAHARHPSHPTDENRNFSAWQSQLPSKGSASMAPLQQYISAAHQHLLPAMELHGSVWARSSLFKVCLPSHTKIPYHVLLQLQEHLSWCRMLIRFHKSMQVSLSLDFALVFIPCFVLLYICPHTLFPGQNYQIPITGGEYRAL